MPLSQAIIPVFVNRCFGTTVLFGVQHHYWMGCSTITFRLLSNFEGDERSHHSVHNIRGLNGLLLYILYLGYWFSFLFYIIAGRVGWWVGSESVLILFIGKYHILEFRFCFLFLIVMTCGCRWARSDCFLFSFV